MVLHVGFPPPHFCYLVAAFELLKLEIFLKINLDQNVEVNNNNFVRTGLNACQS
jgi:hypothetical protein